MADNHADNQVDPGIYEAIRILVVESQDHLNHLSSSIHRVPKTLRDVREKSYTPRIVSIGPYYKDGGNLIHLKEVEVHKMGYALDLFRRLNTTWEKTMIACVDMVLLKIDQIKACYEREMLKTYNDNELAQMMVMDSCFILELVYRSNNNIYENHSFFDNNLRSLYIKHDLLLLENQIPFFVLEDIFENTIRKLDPRASLVNLLLSFLKDMDPFGKVLLLDNHEYYPGHDHILGLLQKCYWHKQAKFPETPSNSAEEFAYAISYSVTELSLAGVKFKPNKDAKWVLAMEFKSSRTPCFCWSWGKPTFKMPMLKIEDYTESVLRNLIAYEQSSSDIPNYITSYAFALERVLDTKEDIVKVIESGLLINNLGSSEQASDMINAICKEVTVNDFFYIIQWRKLHAYYHGYWPKNMAWLRRNYFSSPWSFIALLGALFLFGLTVAQTYYTICPPS